MAYDFDFKRQPTKKSSPIVGGNRPLSNVPVAIPVIRRPAVKRTAQKARWWLLLIVLAIALLAGGFFMSANRPSGNTTQTEAAVDSPESTVASGEIQVFDGGSGQQTAEMVVQQLIDGGIIARYAGKTLSTYPITEIWYDQEYGETAQKIAAVLSAKAPKLNQSKVQGVFTVQVFVGKN
ncbi:MAG: LytR C-terminal domain-containing protein [Patescibacteria group bacterium]